MIQKNADARAAMEEKSELFRDGVKAYEDATKRAKANDQVRFVEFLKWQGEFKSIKSDLLEEKLGLMEDREELRKKKEEQEKLQQKYDRVYAEVKELRKLKYAAKAKAKGPVGVAR